jgi:PAS domain S-box-containing protein
VKEGIRSLSAWSNDQRKNPPRATQESEKRGVLNSKRAAREIQATTPTKDWERAAMATDLRKTGISIVGDMPWGTHFCNFYETKQDLLAILVPFVKAGLENKEFCLWVTSKSLTEEEARSALTQAVPDLDRLLADRSIEILPHDEWYLKGGAFDIYEVLSGWKEKLGQALARGYAGMRVTGDTAWIEKRDWRDFREYEKELDVTVANQRMIVLCTFPLAASGAAELLDVAREHQLAVARRNGNWEVVESQQAKAEIERLNKELEQRVADRTRQLGAIIEKLRKEITERGNVEDALRLSEERFRGAFDHAPIGMTLTSPDGRWLKVNQAFCEVLGYSEQELLAMNFRSVTHPDDLEANLEGYRQLLAGESDSFTMEKRYFHKDGHIVWTNVSTTVVRSAEGHSLYLVVQIYDITERKRAEEALRESEARFREILELMPAGVYVCDKNGIIQHYNPRAAELWGRQPRTGDPDVRFCGCLRHYRPDGTLVPHEESPMAEALRTGIPVRNLEMVLERPDGSRATVMANIAPLWNEEGEQVGAINCLLDITERKAAEEAFAAITEQLRALSGSLQLAREEERARIARELHDELGSALTSLSWDLQGVDEMLSVAGSKAGALQKKITSMTSLVDATIDTVRRIASELRPGILDDLGLMAAIEWHVEQLEAHSGIICQCDFLAENIDLSREQTTALFRIFQEAMTNILRHAEATRVNIRIEEKEGQFVLQVSDNGRGSTEAEKTGSRSLGLLGMRERAHLIGGKIKIDGVAGKGTVLTVQVPLGNRVSE